MLQNANLAATGIHKNGRFSLI